MGANWNPGETSDEKKSGAVFYLVRPADVTKEEWKAVRLTHEPTVHRMHWAEAWKGEFRLLVQPLHGRGNRGGKGENGSRLLAYEVPKDRSDASGWKTSVVEDRLHASHNFDVIPAGGDGAEGEELAIAGAEGIARAGLAEEPREFVISARNAVGFSGAGEVRFDPGKEGASPRYATIEPMHGNTIAVYQRAGETWERTVLDDSLNQGHALAWGDVLGTGEPQVLAGWRGKDKAGKVGIRLYSRDPETGAWERSVIDDNTIACEDLKVFDLDGDGRPEIIAAGRATKNAVIFWNKG